MSAAPSKKPDCVTTNSNLCNSTLVEELVGKLHKSKKLDRPIYYVHYKIGWTHSNEPKRRVLLQAANIIREILCPLCHGGHYIFDCETFKPIVHTTSSVHLLG
nr:uncharacterized protein LOC106621939 isoform X2 [Bactrocera oleae]XP_036220750.1 uncharacterized protein LOC106621939 isoform X2 [Bactrocera oleae]XP_036220751.1 uncharacterized protein LOC106621939 isoform X2 [Bactrocera oleae]